MQFSTNNLMLLSFCIKVCAPFNNCTVIDLYSGPTVDADSNLWLFQTYILGTPLFIATVYKISSMNKVLQTI